MKPTNSPAETLELSCRLAEMMRQRVAKIARLSTLSVGLIESGTITLLEDGPAALALLGCEAQGLAQDVRELTEVLSRLPQIGAEGSHD